MAGANRPANGSFATRSPTMATRECNGRGDCGRTSTEHSFQGPAWMPASHNHAGFYAKDGNDSRPAESTEFLVNVRSPAHSSRLMHCRRRRRYSMRPCFSLASLLVLVCLFQTCKSCRSRDLCPGTLAAEVLAPLLHR